MDYKIINKIDNHYEIAYTNFYNVGDVTCLTFSTFNMILPDKKEEFTTRDLNIIDFRILFLRDNKNNINYYSGMNFKADANTLLLQKLMRLDIENLVKKLHDKKLEGLNI